MSAERTMRLRRAGALALTVALTACSWFTDFKDQPKFDPWTSPNDSIPMRGNPQNSVPIFGSAAPGYLVSRSNLPATLDSLASIPNPVPADARSLLNGRRRRPGNRFLREAGFSGESCGNWKDGQLDRAPSKGKRVVPRIDHRGHQQSGDNRPALR